MLGGGGPHRAGPAPLVLVRNSLESWGGPPWCATSQGTSLCSKDMIPGTEWPEDFGGGDIPTAMD